MRKIDPRLVLAVAAAGLVMALWLVLMSVIVWSTLDAQGITVCVQDNGPGVQPGHEAMIFDRFHQTDLGAQVAHGTGLGLPISRHIAEHFGGRLWLEPTFDSKGGFRIFQEEKRGGSL